MVFHYNKLIRDNIPDTVSRAGGKVAFHTAMTDAEYWMKLKVKFQEEMNKFIERENMESLADTLEVIDAICELKGFDKREVEAVQENRAIELGRYKNRYILDQTEQEIED
jgi:predicted house-cleaning noncanonical NTP pyrophosphatase (MazG superfamily)